MKKIFLISVVATALLFNCGGRKDEAAYVTDSTELVLDSSPSVVDSGGANADTLIGNPSIAPQSPAETPVTQPEPATEPAPSDEAKQDSDNSSKEFFEALPRKIYYAQQKTGVFENEEVDVKIVLWDNENKSVKADKNYTIVISIQRMDPSREQVQSKQWEKQDTITVKQGDEETVYRFVPTESGIYAVICSHPELQPAEWKMNVMSKMKKTGYLPSKTGTPFMFASYRIQQTSAYILVSLQDEKVPMADGEDFAEISFLLVDPDSVIPRDSVRVIIENSKGNLSKKELFVNKIYFANTRLTSSSQGIVTLKFRCTYPNLKPDRETSKINFAVAIDHFELSLSPPEINLFDLTQVIICLKNKDSITVATDRIIPGSFEIMKGSGRFGSDTLKISSGRMQAQIHFQPTAAGLMTIRANVPGLSSQSKEVIVTWPWLLIGLAFSFGLIGSFTANRRKSTKWITILSGGISGLALYWLMVFFFASLAFQVTQAVALNPVTAIVIGMVGGFAGTEVLRYILKKFFGIEV